MLHIVCWAFALESGSDSGSLGQTIESYSSVYKLNFQFVINFLHMQGHFKALRAKTYCLVVPPQISQRNYHSLSAKHHKNAVFLYAFQGARSNRSNPTSYSFYLIGLLWSGDLRETSKLQNTVSFGSPLSLPNMENIGRAQPALQCCTLHSLERDHTHLLSNIES